MSVHRRIPDLPPKGAEGRSLTQSGSSRTPSSQADFEDVEEWRPLNNAWHEERAQYPENPFHLDDDALDALIEPIEAAEDAVVAIPAATLTDVERKLVVLVEYESGAIPGNAPEIGAILADVRSLMGVAS